MGLRTILTNSSHWSAPYTYEVTERAKNGIAGKTIRKTLPSWLKALSITISVVLAPTIIGALSAFFITAAFKNRKINEWHAQLPNDNEKYMRLKFHNFIREPGGHLWANMCWLNAAVKFMASTDMYDPILDIDVSTLNDDEERREILKNLQTHLKAVFAELRTKTGIINKTTYFDLAKAVQNYQKDWGVGINQVDSPEFIANLEVDFNYPPGSDKDPNSIKSLEKYPHLATRLSNENGVNLCPDPPDIFLNSIDVSLSLKDLGTDEEIDLAEILSRTEEVDGPSSKKNHYFTHLPQTLTINLRRVVADGYHVRGYKGPFRYNSETQQLVSLDEKTVLNGKEETRAEKVELIQKKCKRPVKFELRGSGDLKLIEYQIDPTNQNLIKKNVCAYKVIAAIQHTGCDHSQGHYVFHERIKDQNGNSHDLFVTHNDEKVTKPLTLEKAKERLSHSYLFRLEQVSKTPIDEG